jgi:hypothetical protein
MTKEHELASNDISITFKAPPEMETAVGRIGMAADQNKSAVIRACVALALPILQANPSLIYRIAFSEFNINKQ